MKEIFHKTAFFTHRSLNLEDNESHTTNFAELDLEGEMGGARHPYFLQSLVFCNPFEQLQTVLFEVELIIDNTPLTYIYPNIIKTCLTPNHLLFGRKLLCSYNTTSTLIRNITVLSSTAE